MRPRPRNAENRIAEELSNYYIKYGLGAIERKPIIGRTGPDFTLNEMCLVLDAKTRIAVPDRYTKFPASEIMRFGDLIGVRVKDIELLLQDKMILNSTFVSLVVTQWYKHMDQWTEANLPFGITGIVLHKPRMGYNNAVLFIKDLEKYRDRFNYLNNSREGNQYRTNNAEAGSTSKHYLKWLHGYRITSGTNFRDIAPNIIPQSPEQYGKGKVAERHRKATAMETPS